MPDGDDRTGRDDCYICGGGNADILEGHHLVPQRFGGEDGSPNVVELCPSCHAALERLYDERFYSALSVTPPEDDSSGECAYVGCTSTETVIVTGVKGMEDVAICASHRECGKPGCGSSRVDILPLVGESGGALRCPEHQVCESNCGSTNTAVYQTDFGATVRCADHAREVTVIDDEVILE